MKKYVVIGILITLAIFAFVICIYNNMSLNAINDINDSKNNQDTVLQNDFKETINYVSAEDTKLNSEVFTEEEQKIIDLVKEKYPSINIDNYEFVIGETSSSTSVVTGDTNYTGFYYLQFKIGDFITFSGYSIQVKDGKVTEIYDRNIISTEEQNELKKKENEFKALSKEEEEVYKKKALDEVKSNRENVKYEVTDVQYVYDIESKEKKIEIFISVNILNGDLSSSTAYNKEYVLP